MCFCFRTSNGNSIYVAAGPEIEALVGSTAHMDCKVDALHDKLVIYYTYTCKYFCLKQSFYDFFKLIRRKYCKDNLERKFRKILPSLK